MGRTTRIGSISIQPQLPVPTALSFEKLYQAIGLNTGNLMFTQAMLRLLDADVEVVGFSFDPCELNGRFDNVVIPAANWLNRDADWDWFVDRLEKLTIPVTVIGLGLQCSTMNIGDVVVSESSMRLANFLSQRSPAISVRGNFTKKWLQSVGIDNVITTGCPSLYMNIFDSSESQSSNELIFQSTRYGINSSFVEGNSVNHRLFQFAGLFDMPMIFQSEPEEIRLLTYGQSLSSLENHVQSMLCKNYCFSNGVQFDSYLLNKGRVFFNLTEWSNFVRARMGVLGTRLHGSIIALNSGRPALLIPHDSRTAEVAEFAGIPTAQGAEIRDMNTLEELIFAVKSANFEHYKDTRSLNQQQFVDFLRLSDLPPLYRNLF